MSKSNIIFTEEMLEHAFIDEIKRLGYDYVPGHRITRSSLKSPLADELFKESLYRINPDLDDEVDEEVEEAWREYFEQEMLPNLF